MKGRKTIINNATLEELKQTKGLTLRKISKRFNITELTAHSLARKHGLPIGKKNSHQAFLNAVAQHFVKKGIKPDKVTREEVCKLGRGVFPPDARPSAFYIKPALEKIGNELDLLREVMKQIKEKKN